MRNSSMTRSRFVPVSREAARRWRDTMSRQLAPPREKLFTIALPLVFPPPFQRERSFITAAAQAQTAVVLPSTDTPPTAAAELFCFVLFPRLLLLNTPPTLNPTARVRQARRTEGRASPPDWLLCLLLFQSAFAPSGRSLL